MLALGLNLAPAQAYEEWQDWNDYQITGLPEFIAAPTPFTVAVDGPVPVCSMVFNGTTLTAAPWTFIEPLEADEYDVTITTCDGQTDSMWVHALPAFRFGNQVLYPGKTTKKEPAYSVNVYNRLPQPATLTVKDTKGRVLATRPLPSADSPDGGAAMVTFSPGKLTRTASYTITATSAEGLAMSRRVVVPVGWGMMMGRPTDTNCTTLTWYYDARRQPADARRITRDIAIGLGKLRAETGLSFRRTTNRATADLHYTWANQGTHGPSATGSTDGTVTFNTKDIWPEDANAGAGMIKGYLPGRVWLVVHETMHTLGFDHINDRTQIMNPVGTINHFGRGDLEGLHAMYPKAACRA
jgi:hypothetical protein